MFTGRSCWPCKFCQHISLLQAGELYIAATVSVQSNCRRCCCCLFVFSLFLNFSVETFISRLSIEITLDSLFVRFLSLFVVIMVWFGCCYICVGGWWWWGGGGVNLFYKFV